MLPQSALSRRALVAAVTALVAVVPSAEAKKQKPLAFVAATVGSFGLTANATRFDVAVPLEFVHPDSGAKGVTELQMTIALAPSTEAARTEIIKSIKTNVSISLEQLGVNVPPDRVAVALL